MRICNAMRNASRGVLRRRFPGRLAVAGWAWDAPRRGLCLMSVAKGLHDGVMGALEVGAWLSGRRPRPYRWRLLQTSSAEGRRPSAPSLHTSPPSPPTADGDSETSLHEQLRAVMRCLASPVVVCTSTHGTAPRAMTMSSFTSLTLTPTPLVTFNVATPSRTLDAIAASRAFNIHILAGTAAGAAVARHFSRGNAEGVFQGPGLAGVAVRVRGGAPPVMSGEGVLRVLRCRVLHEGPEGGLVRVRDHVVVLGEVVDMIPGRQKTNEFGLAYADRKYRQVGSVISRDP